MSQDATFGEDQFEALKEWIMQHPKVAQAPHRFGGVEFNIEGFEFMHFHGQTHLDIRLSKMDQSRMLKEGKALRHLYAPQAGYITFRIHSNEDVATAKELIELAYTNADEIIGKNRERKSNTPNRTTNPSPQLTRSVNE